MAGFTIGQLARAADCNTAAIRYYEEIGILPKAGRRRSGHRVYAESDLRRLIFIRRCRDFGFSLPEIGDLMAVSGGQPCTAAHDIAQARLSEVKARLRDMQRLEQTLSRFVDRCASTCCGGPGRDCTLYDDLGDGVAAAR